MTRNRENTTRAENIPAVDSSEAAPRVKKPRKPRTKKPNRIAKWVSKKRKPGPATGCRYFIVEFPNADGDTAMIGDYVRTSVNLRDRETFYRVISIRRIPTEQPLPRYHVVVLREPGITTNIRVWLCRKCRGRLRRFEKVEV